MEGYPINMLVTTQHNPMVDRMLTRLRERAGVGVVRVGRSAKQVLSLLKRNEFIAIAPDQHAPGLDMVMDFFGRPASVPRGPALFAIRAGAPILPFAMRRENYDSHVFMTGPAIYPPESGDKAHDVEWMTRQYLDFFEDVIRKYPDQWMWTHRRWKLPQAGGNSA
jgi:KDO2-lipid IV(A) lauroyltransferase